MTEGADTKQGDRTPVEPGKGIHAKGCGQWIGYCGHRGISGQDPVTLSGKCTGCGKPFKVTCSSSTCTGRDFHC